MSVLTVFGNSFASQIAQATATANPADAAKTFAGLACKQMKANALKGSNALGANAQAVEAGRTPRPVAGKLAAALNKVRESVMDHETAVDFGTFKIFDNQGKHVGYGAAVLITLEAYATESGKPEVTRTRLIAFDLAGKQVLSKLE